MKIPKIYILLILCIFAGTVIIFSNTSNMRLLKTLYLIATVSPYEQVIPGASSILVLGDSTGYGTGAGKKEDSIAGRIGKDFPEHTIKNNSKNGRTIGELVPVVEKLTSQHELILLQIGGNDILQERDITIVEAELRQIIRLLGPHTSHVVMMSSGNVGGVAAFSGAEAEKFESLTRDFRTMFLTVASETGMTYVDMFLEPEVDIFIQEPKIYTSWDDLHPSSAGYGVWYQSVGPVLNELLR
jgi:lysophospholipase L1-like esterase